MQHYLCLPSAAHKGVGPFDHGVRDLDVNDGAAADNKSIQAKRTFISNIWSHLFSLEKAEYEHR